MEIHNYIAIYRSGTRSWAPTEIFVGWGQAQKRPPTCRKNNEKPPRTWLKRLPTKRKTKEKGPHMEKK